VTDRILSVNVMCLLGEMENSRFPSSQPSAAGRCTVSTEQCREEDGGDQML
jgi:hypothetical protein